MLEPASDSAALRLIRRGSGVGDHASGNLAALTDEDDIRGLVAILMELIRDRRVYSEGRGGESRSARLTGRAKKGDSPLSPAPDLF